MKFSKAIFVLALLWSSLAFALGERIPQSVTIRVPLKAYLSTTHITPATGQTLGVVLAKNMAAFANPSAGATNATEVSNGWYYVDLSTTDTGTTGPLVVRCTASGVDDVEIVFDVVNAHNAGFDGIAGATAGAANGLPINGSNTGPVSFNGGVTYSNSGGDAFTLTSSGSNGNGLNASGNGTGSGIKGTGGATGRGIYALGGATSGSGLRAEAQAGSSSYGLHGIGYGTGDALHLDGGTAGSGLNATAGSSGAAAGIQINGGGTGGPGIATYGAGNAAGISTQGGATGTGLQIAGGATSGDGIAIITTLGDGVLIAPTAGHGVNIAANGTNKHGIFLTGGTAGTSDGIKAVAGTGGVDIRGNITGNLHGTVDTLTTYTGNTPQTGDAFALIGTAGAGLTGLASATNMGTLLTRLPGPITLVGGAVELDLTQAVSQTDLTQTVGGCFNACKLQGTNKWAIVNSGSEMDIYGSDGTTIVEKMTLSPAVNNASRTPQ
jgi:hypothetical protein